MVKRMNSLIVFQGKNSILCLSSPMIKLYDAALFFAAMMILNFQLETQLGKNAFTSSKISFLLQSLEEGVRKGQWMLLLPCLLPLAVGLLSLISFGIFERYSFSSQDRKARIQKMFLFFPFVNRTIPFEAIKRILLLKHKERSEYLLLAEESSGRKNVIQKSGSKERLKNLARKIQDISQLPFNQKLQGNR